MLQRIKQFLHVLYATYNQWQKDDGAQQAASVSYYMALSFFPLVLVLLSIIGTLFRATGWGQDARQRMIEVISLQMGDSLAGQVSALLDSLETNAGTSGPIGLGILVLTAMMVFAQFESAFDRIWNVPPPESRGLLHSLVSILWYRLRAFLMLLCAGVFLLVGFVATVSLSTAAQYSASWLPMPGLWSVLTAVVGIAGNWLVLTLIYRALPKAPVRWREAAGGALIAALLWDVGRRILASFVIGSKYSVYGVVGAFIAMMLWVYYAMSVIFLGAEFVQVICRDCKRVPEKPGSGGNAKKATKS